MIHEGTGNLLAAEVDALVNTVNTVGVMGKGVALQFKQAFPANFREYSSACQRGEVRIGHMFVTQTGVFQPAYVINFPTKRHWKEPARIGDVQAGLSDLIRVVREENIRSIAVPPLGCGLGGLRWEHVRPLIVHAFESVPGVDVFLFAPGQPVQQESRIVRTNRPEMNAWRAALISLIDVYGRLSFEATHHEAQKLLYFLVAAGEPVRSTFEKGAYGPFDPNMRHAIQQMEGHYVMGFGDGRRLDPVSLAPGAADEAARFLADRPETYDRIGRVGRLIRGFETPYGLELLATVHWLSTREDAAAIRSSERAVEMAQEWSPRKRRALNAHDLNAAWTQLRDQGWLVIPLVQQPQVV
jgi:O-acetyl-ADP-ribose deacetylase (regulator of RNase III)